MQEDPLDPEGNVRKHQAIDERYRIGHVVKIKQLPNSAYAGVIELTHPGAISAFKSGKIPRYVSPAVYNLNMTGPQGEFTSFEPLHIAFVDEPAYGLKASILDTCQGKEGVCLRNLGVAAVMGESCVMKALSHLENVYSPSHSSYTKSNASIASELSLKEDSATNPAKDKAASSTEQSSNKPEATPESNKAPNKQQSTSDNEGKPKDIKDKDSKESKTPTKEQEPQQKASISKEDIASVLEDLKSSLKSQITDQIAESIKVYHEETIKEQERKATREAKRRLIESYVTLESAGNSKEEQEKRINALMHIPQDELVSFLEVHYKITGKSRSNAAKAAKVSDFNRGMQQNAPNNVGSAALLLDQETNDRIDRVLSIGRFIPANSTRKIVPTSVTTGDTA